MNNDEPMTLAQAAEAVQAALLVRTGALADHSETKQFLDTATDALAAARIQYREIERTMRDVLGPKTRGPRKPKPVIELLVPQNGTVET